MKNFILLLSILIITVTCSSDNDGANGYCIDVSQISNTGVCYEIYDPVWVCDNETYENDCKVGIKGILNYTEGSYS